MKKAEIIEAIKREEKDLQEAIETCKRLGCYIDDTEFYRNRNQYTLEQCTAHIRMYCAVAELNFQRRELAKKNKETFTDDMIYRLAF